MRKRRKIYGLVIAALALCAFSGAASEDGGKAPPIVVAVFSDGISAGVGSGLAEAARDLFMAELASRPGVRLVDRDLLAKTLAELELTLIGFTDAAQGVRVGKLLGAKRLITGSLLPGEARGEALFIVHMLDVDTGVVVSSHKERGALAELAEMTAILSKGVAEALELPTDTGTPIKLERGALALANYLRGVGSFQAGDYEQAIMELAMSNELGIAKPETHYLSGRAYQALDEPDHAIVEYRRFLDIAPTERREAEMALLECHTQLREREAKEY